MKYPIRNYIGKPEQIFSVREGRLSGGKADGVHFIEVDNGTGLHVTLLPDRCLDIYQVRVNGRSLNYLTANGIAAPAYYNPFGEGWSDGFYGGFLFTCGLTNIGLKGSEGWETEKEHGCIANSPARHVNLDYGEDGMSVVISGTMHEGILGGANLLLTRKVELRYGENTIRITDSVKNDGCRPIPMMLLYHCNTGYPLLSEDAVLELPHRGAVRGRTPHAAAHLDSWQQIEPPQDEYEERCYYFTPDPEADGWAKATLRTPAEGLSLEIAYDTSTLDRFLQWKNFVKGEYVMGLEPCNATLDGRSQARENGSLKILQPGEVKNHHLCFTVRQWEVQDQKGRD